MLRLEVANYTPVQVPYGDSSYYKYTKGINKPIYAVNNLFLSTLSLTSISNQFHNNGAPLITDYIVSSAYNDKNQGKKVKNKGNITFYQNSFPRYQTGTVKEPSYFNQANQIAINWPQWLKTRFNNNSNKVPIIRKIITDHSNGNTYGNANYYAFVDFDDTISLVYLNNEDSNFNLAENQGVPNTISIYHNNNYDSNFDMTSPSNLLYVISKTCN